MTKLTIGIGEDFPIGEEPVEEKAGAEDCRGSRGHHRHHHHHHHGELHARWHTWLHARFGRRRQDKKDDMNTNKKDGE
jgi:hypothetical protein